MSDGDLVAAARGGDPAGLGVLLERHRADMRAVAVARLGYAPAAEDAVQDAMVTALRRLGDLRDPAAADRGCGRSSATSAACTSAPPGPRHRSTTTWRAASRRARRPPGHRHFPFSEEPEVFHRVITGFLEHAGSTPLATASQTAHA